MHLENKHNIIMDYIMLIIDIHKYNEKISRVEKSYILDTLYKNNNLLLKNKRDLLYLKRKYLYEKLEVNEALVNVILNKSNRDQTLIFNYIKSVIKDCVTSDILNKYDILSKITRSSVIDSLFYKNLKVVKISSGERPVLRNDVIISCSKKTGIVVNTYVDRNNMTFRKFFNLFDTKREMNEDYDFIEPRIISSIYAYLRSNEGLIDDLFNEDKYDSQPIWDAVNNLFYSKTPITLVIMNIDHLNN